MSKFVLSAGLVLASLSTLVGAVAAKAPAPCMQETSGSVKFSTNANQGIPNGPYDSFAAAELVVLNLRNLGIDVSDPYKLDDGWYFDTYL